jgi:hypothetical protein
MTTEVTIIMDWEDIETRWDEQLHGASGDPPPLDAEMPVPLEVSGLLRLMDQIWGLAPVPVLLRRFQNVTAHDYAVLQVYFREAAESAEAHMAQVGSLAYECEKRARAAA